MTPPAGLLHTSVFIARETGRPVGALPERVAVSVVTIGELQLGVLHASEAVRAQRAETLALARTADPIPVSEAVMVTWARGWSPTAGPQGSSARSSCWTP